MNIIHIDTSDNTKAKATLSSESYEYSLSSRSDSGKRSQEALLLIDQILKKANIALSDIDKIQVTKGPGSFTGLRVGISIANALSFCLQKKLNEKELGEIEIPEYSTS